MSIAFLVAYRTDTGEIVAAAARPLASVSAATLMEGVPPDTPPALLSVLSSDRFHDPAREYVQDGEIVDRPALPAFDTLEILADGEDTATLSLPELMIVKIDGVEHGPTDLIEIVSDMPATYAVLVEHFPYLPLNAEISAV